ncbi:MAG: glycine zipper domain-containing protein [Desulfobaccales bacterium]|nr:glycine zipper domain-containing protein [Desulfobaccales bacterium]
MARKILVIPLVFILIASLFGCATNGYYDPARSAGAGVLGGAATGAALGAIIGAATGSAATGAWVGAAAGAVVGGVGGYLYANHMNNQTRSAQAAAQTYNYSPAQGNVVAIEKADVNPSRARAGQQVSMVMAYTFLTPSNAPVSATLSREVQMGGATVGQPYQVQVNNANGSYVDQVAFTVPNNATPGTYTVTNRVTSGYGSAVKNTYFIVE